MARKPAKPREAYQLKITLIGSKPTIWRRVLVAAEFTLEELHWVIQVAMPWKDSHLHQFHDKRGTRYSDGRFGLEEVTDEARTTLSEALRKPKDRIVYEYDFGDGWEHLVVLEKIAAAEPKQSSRRASRASGPPRPRTAAASGAMRICLTCSEIRITRNMTTWSNG